MSRDRGADPQSWETRGFRAVPAGHDESMDDWFDEGYTLERDDARTEKYRVSFDIEYDPQDVVDLPTWLTLDYLAGLFDLRNGENIAVTDVTITERGDE